MVVEMRGASLSGLLALVGVGLVIVGALGLIGLIAVPGAACIVVGLIVVLVAALVGGRFHVTL